MIWIALIGFSISFFTVYLMLHFSDRLGLIDVPNARSSHEKPTPKGGGLGIVLALSISLTVYFAVGYWGTDTRAFVGLIAGILIVGLIGFLDDLRNLSMWIRLICQLLAATIAVVGIGPLRSIHIPFMEELHLGALAIPISLLWIMSVTNIYNFIDGIDGLAAGEGVLGGAFLACIGIIVGNTQVAAIGLFIAAASLGFLVFNFPPAKIFMGDTGSTTLGFTIAATALIGSHSAANSIPFFVFVLLLSNFLVDGIFTLVKRIGRGERWYHSHREHYYQKAVISGYSHRQVTLCEYVIELLLGSSAIVYVLYGESLQLTILLLWLVLFTGLCMWLSFSRVLKTQGEPYSDDKVSHA